MVLLVLVCGAGALADDLHVADTWLLPDVEARPMDKILIVGMTTEITRI